MKHVIITILIVFPLGLFAQEKDSLLKKDINEIVEILEFMYEYDQALREYTVYKTFDKSETNRIENLPDSLLRIENETRQFESDTISKYIWANYINPMDAMHTRNLIEITKKYGFPTKKRMKRYYNKEFSNPEFSPLLIFIHSPKNYWNEVELLMTNEYNEGRIDRCTYGYLKWHVNGRNDMKHFLENGYKFVEDENGNKNLRPVDCN
jgi:hypothetical protein